MQNNHYKKHNIDVWKKKAFELKLYNTNYIKGNGLHFNIVYTVANNCKYLFFGFSLSLKKSKMLNKLYDYNLLYLFKY